MSDILKIRAMSAPWQGLNYSVSWDGRGVVAQPNGVKSIWDCALKACTRGFRLGFSFGEQAVSIDAMTMQAGMQSTEYLHHLVQQHGGISGVAFEYREEAESFVDELDKVIMWKMLKRDFNE